MKLVSSFRVNEMERVEYARAARRIVSSRFFVETVAYAIGTVLVLTEPASWRQTAMLFCLVVTVTATVLDLRRLKRREVHGRLSLVSILVYTVVLLVACATTGGLASPLVLTSAIVLTLTSTNPGARLSVPLLALMIAETWTLAMLQAYGMAGLPVAFGGPSAPAFTFRFAVLWAVLATAQQIMATVAGLRYRLGNQELIQRVSEAREDALKLYAEQPQLVSALLGELAHEVKNPMASVKALASLVAKDQSGKNAERLEVMRRELERMQAALEDLLNFSRPLGPLAQEQVDLGGICANVARLHEGMLSAKSLNVAVPREGTAQARCDPQKVKQVVVNLLQNAIEASPPGETIEIQIAPRDAGRVAVSVLDRGKGVDPRVADRLFQPGTTTKPKGSGLGLTVARTMALQHGGELALAPREGGGCSATLVLPLEGAD